MRLFVLFALREGEEDSCPEAIDVIDDASDEGNPEFRQEQLKKRLDDKSIKAAQWFELSLHSDTSQRIRETLVGAPKIHGILKGAVPA